MSGGDAELELWDKRAVEYWALQGLKYGWVIDLDNTQTVIAGEVIESRAEVLHVVPGERIEERAWRAKNSPASLVDRLGLDRA